MFVYLSIIVQQLRAYERFVLVQINCSNDWTWKIHETIVGKCAASNPIVTQIRRNNSRKSFLIEAFSHSRVVDIEQQNSIIGTNFSQGEALPWSCLSVIHSICQPFSNSASFFSKVSSSYNTDLLLGYIEDFSYTLCVWLYSLNCQ